MSIGDTLAQARRQAGLTITQVGDKTRIRESIIAAIEQDDFSPCGGDFYARGHIKAMASVVGTDPVALVREYDAEHAPGDMPAAQIFESATPIRIRESRSPRLAWAVAVVAAAAIGFGAYQLFSPHDAKPAATAASKVRHVAKAKPSVSAAKPTASASTAPGQAVIRVDASQACWVGLSTPSGVWIYQGTIPAGSSMTWHEKNAVSLQIGNPPGVTLTVNGKPEQMNTVQVVTLSIDPLSKTPVTVG